MELVKGCFYKTTNNQKVVVLDDSLGGLYNFEVLDVETKKAYTVNKEGKVYTSTPYSDERDIVSEWDFIDTSTTINNQLLEMGVKKSEAKLSLEEYEKETMLTDQLIPVILNKYYGNVKQLFGIIGLVLDERKKFLENRKSQ